MNFKKILSTSLTFIFLLASLTACGDKTNNVDNQNIVSKGNSESSGNSSTSTKDTGNNSSNTNGKINETAPQKTIKVGSYVKIGSYRSEPIIWKCVDTSNGPLLIANKILCIKPYDAAEGGEYTLSAKSTPEETKGSSKWATSNIREWLNSSEQKVKYSTTPPTEKAVNYNWYDDEPGFLTGFTKDELSKIVAVGHDGIGDWIFLLSREEAKKYIPSNTRITVTSKAINKERAGYSFTDFYIWTRTAESNYSVWAILGIDCNSYKTSNPCLAGACGGAGGFGEGGILPALNLNTSSYVSGDGTLSNPYTLK